jgi:hypothetical protein
MYRSLIVVVWLGWMSGCALTPADTVREATEVPTMVCDMPATSLSVPEALQEPSPLPIETLLSYVNDLALMDPASLRDEHKRLQTMLAHQPTSDTRLRMATLLSMPGSALQDDGRAEALLKEVVRDQALDTESRTFARMLLNRSVQKVRTDNKRKELAALLKTEQEARTELEEKLKALTSIEKSMSDQQNPAPQGAVAPALEAPAGKDALVNPVPTQPEAKATHE